MWLKTVNYHLTGPVIRHCNEEPTNPPKQGRSNNQPQQDKKNRKTALQVFLKAFAFREKHNVWKSRNKSKYHLPHVKSNKALPTCVASSYRVPEVLFSSWIWLIYLQYLHTPIPASYTYTDKGDEGLNTQICHSFQSHKKEVSGECPGLKLKSESETSPSMFSAIFQFFAGCVPFCYTYKLILWFSVIPRIFLHSKG